MAENQKFIDALNDALSWELAGIIQYLQHSVLLTGPHRETFKGFFHEGSEEAHDHAEIVAGRIAALGGVPTVEPARIRQAADLEEMLEATLALEIDALRVWERAHEVAVETDAAKGHIYWLEEHIAEEQEHVDEMRKLTSKVSFKGSELSNRGEQTG